MASSTSPTLELPSVKELQSTEQLKLLDVVDQLRAHGLSEITALPQLIVCGDQSSGKSSVLEAISGVPFPKQENVSTRFATEVILRRSARQNIKISIVPSRDRRGEERNRALAFRHELTSQEDFEELFKRAEDIILSGAKKFSRDILRIELNGPSQPQLTLVDVPGLIHSSASAKAVDDIKLVSELVDSYLENPRSIILAIVSAAYDIANQIVLQRARQFDKQGIRTLGIITKPDTLKKDTLSENAFLRLARNEEFNFHLGWHVVKNIDSQLQDSLHESRDEQERNFFKESNFGNLPSSNIGIATLRTRLSKVLFGQIRTELPRLLADIERRMSATESARDKIGPGRQKLEEQKDFLIDLSDKFQQICRSAVRGDYDHEFFRNDPDGEKRLCANVMKQHSEFANKLRAEGAKWNIVDEEGGGVDERAQEGLPTQRRNRTRKDAVQEVIEMLKDNCGWELPGLPNPLVVGSLFREYSQPWADIALNHVQNVWDTTNRFLELVLLHLTEADVYDKIHRVWLYPKMEEKLLWAKYKLRELLEVHDEHPFTRNHYFLDNRKEIQRKKTQKRIQEQLANEPLKFARLATEEFLNSILSSSSPKTDDDMDLIAAEDAFDNMNAYYQVAMNRFTDNVPMLAIHGPILRNLHEILTPKAVNKMDTDTITQIAGESEEKTRERGEILHKLATLEAGARICKQYAMRPGSVLVRSSEQNSELTDRQGARREASKGKAPAQLTKYPSSDARPSSQGGERVNATGHGHLEVPERGIVVSPSRSRSAGPEKNSMTSESAKAQNKTTSASTPVELVRSSSFSTIPGQNPTAQSSPSIFSSLGSGSAPANPSNGPTSSSSGLFSSNTTKASVAADPPSASTASGPFNFAKLPSPTAQNQFTGSASKPSLFAGSASKPSLFAGLSSKDAFGSSSSTAVAPATSLFGESSSTPTPLFNLFGGISSQPVVNTGLSKPLGSTPTATSTSTTPLGIGSGSGTSGSTSAGGFPGRPLPEAGREQPAFSFNDPISSPPERNKENIIPMPLSTHNVIFRPYVDPDPYALKQINHFQTIGFAEPFKNFSFEEVHLKDHKDGATVQIK